MPTKEEVTEFLRNNPQFAKEYFLTHASPKLVETWVMQRSRAISVPDVNRVNKISRSSTDLVLRPLTATSNVRLNRFLSGTSGHGSANNLNVGNVGIPPIRPKRKTFEELSALNEKDLFMELIRDIAHELDVDALSHKILVNVSVLTKCDRSSLFLCKGHKDRKYLISRLFDVTADCTVEEAVKPIEDAIIIPFGVGIAGNAAATGEIINIEDAYKDPRFNRKIDEETGYKTHSILCMPIKNQDLEVIGVAQIINKKEGDQRFTAKDIEVFENYLTFCGIGLTNAQLFESSVQEFTRNQVLLNLARNIFEDTECLDTVVRRIMTHAQDLILCQRCTVYIIDKTKSEESEDGENRVVFSSVFDLIQDETGDQSVQKDYWQDLAAKSTEKSMVYSGFAMLCAQTGDVMNIDGFGNDKLCGLDDESFKADCMLCAPIYNNHNEVIGVAQLLNKKDAHSFDENDEAMFEGFAIFCGLGIHNTQMYEKAALMLARQKLNMEVLQYHASAGPVDTDQLANAELPSVEHYKLDTFEFDDIGMTDLETCMASVRMYTDLDLLHRFNVPQKTMCNFILTVKKNYRPVTYHNWRHAFNVAQSMFTLLKAGQMLSWFSDLELFILLTGCLCHDLDHRGTNNQFQLKSGSAIARLYGTSTMEHHHFDHSVMILKSEGSNIFDNLNDEDYKLAIKLLEESILSTDLALYFKKRSAFQNLVETKKADWTQFENRAVLRGMMMTACDVAAITKPWEIQQRVAELVASEFFEQGDIERSEYSSDPIPMMDRNKHSELPSMQVGFIDFVCLPLYKVFYHINPLLKPLYDGVIENKKNWQGTKDVYDPKKVVVIEPPKDTSQNRKLSHATKTNQKNNLKKVSISVPNNRNNKSAACSLL